MAEKSGPQKAKAETKSRSKESNARDRRPDMLPVSAQSPVSAQLAVTAQLPDTAQLPITLQLPGLLQRAMRNPHSLDPASLNSVQSVIGMRATRRLINGAKDAPQSIRRKIDAQASLQNLMAAHGFGASPVSPAASGIVVQRLTVGAADDPYEREAERVAAQVMHSPEPAAVQRHPGHGDEEEQLHRSALVTPAIVQRHSGHAEEEDHLHRSTLAAAITPLTTGAMGATLGDVQAHGQTAADSFQVGRDFEQQLSSASSGGSPLPDNTRSFMESRIGADFSDVRVHTGSASHELNRAVSAEAFTHGSHIFLGAGRDNIQSSSGRALLAHELTHTVQQGAAPVQRHPEPETEEPVQRRVVQRRTHGAGCGCAHCGGKMLEATLPLQRQAAKRDRTSHGAGCGCANCAGVSLVKGGPVQRRPASDVIQRHSSWEHKSLGDMPPGELAKIGAWQDLLNQTKKEGMIFKTRDENKVASLVVPGVGAVKKADVLHLLAQEMNRLNAWQKGAPTDVTPGTEQTGVVKEDPQWQVNLVKVGRDNMVVTYGELNTLADYYGSAEAMQTAEPDKLRELVQSVRMETYDNFKRIYSEVFESLTEAEKKNPEVRKAHRMYAANSPEYQDPETTEDMPGTFEGSMMVNPSTVPGQLELIGGVQSIGTTGASNKYGSGLARNACHFAPESWHAWTHYHQQALLKAHSSYAANHQDVPNQKQSADDANEAMLLNGFGDHYLQDSFASGHLINKTKIMAWYVQYIDENDDWTYHQDKNWRMVQNIAYKQGGLTGNDQYTKSKVGGANKGMNPQSVVNAHPDSWHDQFVALGLTAPSSVAEGTNTRKILEWWQVSLPASIRGDALLARALKADPSLGLAEFQIIVAVLNLQRDGILRDEDLSLTGRGARMADAGVRKWDANTFKSRTFILRDEYKGNQGKQGSTMPAGGSYTKAAEAITFKDYDMFMRSAFIQKATNALHDVFCENGLVVGNKQDGDLYKVYGDDRMFNQGSSEGVKYSAETANMSRESIKHMIKHDNDGGMTTASIIDRVPSYVKAPTVGRDGKANYAGGQVMSFVDWHNPQQQDGLRKFCFNKVFKDMNGSLTQRLAPGLMSDLGQLTDARPDASEEF